MKDNPNDNDNVNVIVLSLRFDAPRLMISIQCY